MKKQQREEIIEIVKMVIIGSTAISFTKESPVIGIIISIIGGFHLVCCSIRGKKQQLKQQR